MQQIVDQIGIDGFTNDALNEQYLLVSAVRFSLLRNPKEKEFEEDENDDAQK